MIFLYAFLLSKKVEFERRKKLVRPYHTRLLFFYLLSDCTITH